MVGEVAKIEKVSRRHTVMTRQSQAPRQAI
jgi:hypothetical protein